MVDTPVREWDKPSTRVSENTPNLFYDVHVRVRTWTSVVTKTYRVEDEGKEIIIVLLFGTFLILHYMFYESLSLH